MDGEEICSGTVQTPFISYAPLGQSHYWQVSARIRSHLDQLSTLHDGDYGMILEEQSACFLEVQEQLAGLLSVVNTRH